MQAQCVARAELASTWATTIIKAPDDGVVLSRSVEIGQTVAAGMQTPTLFVIARDLETMRVNASVDESESGAKKGQNVTFTVDAYGQEVFTGKGDGSAPQPMVTSGVVSYPTVIEVPNPVATAEAGHDRDGQHRSSASGMTCCACPRRRPVPPGRGQLQSDRPRRRLAGDDAHGGRERARRQRGAKSATRRRTTRAPRRSPPPTAA